MPILDWIGKEKVINHHMEVPFRVLEPSYTYGLAESSVSRTQESISQNC